MKLRACSTSHFISAIEEGMVKKVHNVNSNGRPSLKFKKLQDIYQAADAMLQDSHDNAKFSGIRVLNEPTNLPFADRKTKARNGYVFEEDEPESSSNEKIHDDMPLSQLIRKPNKKKRKASESVVTPKTEFDDSDLNEPLFKLRVKAPKTPTKKMSANESSPATVVVKVEDPEMDYFECREIIHIGDVSLESNESATFIASESGILYVNHELNSNESESFTNEGENCGFNEVSFDSLDETMAMVLYKEENMSNVNQSPSIVSSVGDDSLVEDLITSTSDSFQSQPIPDQVNHICSVQDSVSADVDMISLSSDTIPVVSEDTSIVQEQVSFVPANADLEVTSSHNDKTDIKNEQSDCIEPRHTERLPSTRKAISPTSQEKLCLAMKSEELLDDIDHYKCKEKLSFEEQPDDNNFSSTKSNTENSQTSEHQKVKAVVTPKIMLKKAKSYKRGSPPQKSLSPKGCLDGPRLCRSLPRLSSGCTTVEGCSESAIAFSQRQMHDIESLASKLMSELNSMKAIVEEKLLFEAYRSPSLKNEADEVKTAIKTATKTEETAKKWLSMMSRDCSRFCKIMKLNEDKNASGSGSGSGSGDPAVVIEEKSPVQREKKKISFADEAGGALCDIKVYEIDETSIELKQKPES